MNRKRVERIWRREGLKVPQKQPKRGRLWLNDGSCIRLRPEYPGHVWAYDFVEGRTHDGRKFRILAIIDEASRECMALLVARRIRSADVLAILAELFVIHGPPAHIRSDNGPEFIATAVKDWWHRSGCRRFTSRLVARGRMAIVNRSTAACVMSCLMAKYSTALPKPKS